MNVSAIYLVIGTYSRVCICYRDGSFNETTFVIHSTNTRTPNANLKLVLIMNILFRCLMQNLPDQPLHIKASLLSLY